MRQPIIIAVVVVIAVVLNASAFVVTEVEQAIITQFGEPIGGAITEPGLHWKVPFVQKSRVLIGVGLSGMAKPPKCQPAKKRISLSIHLPAGES